MDSARKGRAVGQGQDDGHSDEIDVDIDDTGGVVDDDGASDGGDAGDGGGGDGQPADGGTPGKPPLPRPTPPKQTSKPGGDWRPPTREEWEAQTKAGRLAAREAKERKEELPEAETGVRVGD